MAGLEVIARDELPADSAEGRAWEALTTADPASGLMQSLAWAAFRRRQGLRTLHLGLHEAGHLIGGAHCYAAPNPSGPSLLLAPEGPVLPWADEARARAGLRLLLAAAERAAPAFGALALRIEPRLAPPRPRLLRAFGRAPVDHLPTETLYLDLDGPEEAILAQMRPKGRYNIRLADRHGVTVRVDASPATVHRFYAVVREAAERDGFLIEPLSFFTTLAETLGPAGLAHLLVAERAGEPLASMILTTYGARATYLYGGITHQQRHLMAGYALQWAAIRLARQTGCRVYDFYGYEPFGAPDHLFASFSRFKRQFGGRPLRFVGAHDAYFLDRLAAVVIQAVHETTTPA